MLDQPPPAPEHGAPDVAQVEASAMQPDEVTMATYSWGKLISKWTLHSDGSGQLTSTRQVSSNFNDYVVVTKRLDATPGRYEQINSVLRAAEIYGGKQLPCSLAFTDGPYGQVSWRRHGIASTLSVQYGCRSPEADKVYDQLGAAQALVEKWGANAPITEERKPDNSSGRH